MRRKLNLKYPTAICYEETNQLMIDKKKFEIKLSIYEII